MRGDRSNSRSWAGAGWALVVSVAAASGCAGSGGFQFRGTTALSFLRQVRESDDPNVRYAAYDRLGSPNVYDNDEQKAETAKLLIANMRSGKEPVATRAVICRTLGMLRRPEARKAILEATEDDDPLVRAEACRAVGRVGQTEDATILARVMAVDTSGECRIAAIESLGELKAKDRRINEFLVAGMEHDDPAIRVACLHALRSITGKDLGVEAEAWKKYIESTAPTVPDSAVDSKVQVAPRASASPGAARPGPLP